MKISRLIIKNYRNLKDIDIHSACPYRSKGKSNRDNDNESS